jgi:hypothetical protein
LLSLNVWAVQGQSLRRDLLDADELDLLKDWILVEGYRVSKMYISNSEAPSVVNNLRAS